MIYFVKMCQNKVEIHISAKMQIDFPFIFCLVSSLFNFRFLSHILKYRQI